MITQFRTLGFLILLFVASLLLAACSGDDSSGSNDGETASITSFELLDPTSHQENYFGLEEIVILANGNIVVVESNDSQNFTVSGLHNGAVHLYNPYTQTRLASYYGNNFDDQLGRDGITVLANNNFVIASSLDNVGNIENAGSIILVDGTTGLQIGSTLTGNDPNDRFGFGSITALANNNFVVASPLDDVENIENAGSIMLIDGTTGLQIGRTLAGDAVGDQLGSEGIAVLPNNNFVVASSNDDEGSIVDAGSVMLVNGATGLQIGNTLAGNVTSDQLGSGGITVLPNNNYVVASSDDDEGSIVDAGSVILVNGATGLQIGNTLAGDMTGDQLGTDGITVLSNNNYVVASRLDDEGGIVNAGSVRLVDGNSGAQIGSTLAGDTTGDLLGSGSITVLANNNYVIASPYDNEGGIMDVGIVILMDGSTGLKLGNTLAGDVAGDSLSSNGIIALSNNNFVISSSYDDVGSIVDAGSVILVDGATGMQLGNTLAGDVTDDRLSYNYDGKGITALSNNNYLITSMYDDVGDIVDAGSVRLMDGSTGLPIGSVIAGPVSNDVSGFHITEAGSGEFYILARPALDNNGVYDSGLVELIAQ